MFLLFAVENPSIKPLEISSRLRGELVYFAAALGEAGAPNLPRANTGSTHPRSSSGSKKGSSSSSLHWTPRIKPRSS